MCASNGCGPMAQVAMADEHDEAVSDDCGDECGDDCDDERGDDCGDSCGDDCDGGCGCCARSIAAAHVVASLPSVVALTVIFDVSIEREPGSPELAEQDRVPRALAS